MDGWMAPDAVRSSLPEDNMCFACTCTQTATRRIWICLFWPWLFEVVDGMAPFFSFSLYEEVMLVEFVLFLWSWFES